MFYLINVIGFVQVNYIENNININKGYKQQFNTI